MNLWSIAAIYIGGIIGAGFASGQELVVFFVQYGRNGFWGILVATAFLTLGSGLVLEYCARKNVSSYDQIFIGFDSRLRPIFDFLYSAFLLIGIGVMLSGVGAMGDRLWTGILVRLGTALLIFASLRKGIAGVAQVSAWLAPILVAILCGFAVYRFQVTGVDLPQQGSWRALESAVLYGAYNLGFSMAVLASIHGHAETRAKRWKFALGANLILGVTMFILYFALGSLSSQEFHSPFPLEYLLQGSSSVALVCYRFLLWGAMFSTAIGNALALVTRITHSPMMSWSKASLIVVFLSLALSFFGFSTLIRVAYPIVGLACLWILANLTRALQA